ncbi:uncharacterized protein BYT42DRAFT_564175 [Radiomyces spectabilis]|uniref:uncharacterized protein n=1 Tax=Radiomyces spectabilis TaxID=64574 RepID=UPI002220F658|nr:uncharacterized protein BYT42DRAFT_564175 [Radiomyces spectabilis]KAI8384948.1 hypothetical protein BYT42DRAFT_564175 [Radiomyces spectabilis]
MGVRMMAYRSLESLPLRPSVLTRSLPADAYTATITDLQASDRLLRVSRPVQNSVFSFIPPESAPDPKTLAVSSTALRDLEVDPEVTQTDEFAQVFSGNKLLGNTRPWALCYAGHQFGFFAGQLGDGRAISLFETENSKGDRWEIQLKGAGRTPYSRFGDGYAVLRSSIREFLMSEHMHALRIPTTRALALIGTSRQVFREDAPADVAQPERGAIVARFAPSWLRFGNFEIFYSRDDYDNVRALADYAIKEVVKEEGEDDSSNGNRYERFFRRIAKNTAKMVAEWQAIGFNHGVMNTDNMSLLGLTLDYGPFQMLDFYEPGYICNHTDTGGQYAFKRQPTVCIFNLFKLGVPLFELIGAGNEVDSLVFPSADETKQRSNVTSEGTRAEYRETGKETVTKLLSEEFSDWFMDHLAHKMQLKLGLTKKQNAEADMQDLIIPLLDWMTEHKIDYHRFFRSLSNYRTTEAGEDGDACSAIQDQLDIVPQDASNLEESKQSLTPWLAMYRHRLLEEGAQDNERKQRMDSVNPRFVLRNWIAQDVISAFDNKSEDEAVSILQACLRACANPYQDKYDDACVETWINTPTPEWAQNLKCSCSS